MCRICCAPRGCARAASSPCGVPRGGAPRNTVSDGQQDAHQRIAQVVGDERQHVFARANRLLRPLDRGARCRSPSRRARRDRAPSPAIASRIATTRFGRDQRDDAQHRVARHQRHDHRRPRARVDHDAFPGLQGPLTRGDLAGTGACRPRAGGGSRIGGDHRQTVQLASIQDLDDADVRQHRVWPGGRPPPAWRGSRTMTRASRWHPPGSGPLRATRARPIVPACRPTSPPSSTARARPPTPRNDNAPLARSVNRDQLDHVGDRRRRADKRVFFRAGTFRFGAVGTTFSSMQIRDSPDPRGEAKRPTAARLILLVEDDFVLRSSLSELLIGGGFPRRVRRRRPGGPAPASVGRRRPTSSCWTSCCRTSTASSCGRCRSRSPLVANIPVVVISAYDLDPQSVDELGLPPPFRKPLDIEKLLSTIRDLTAARAHLSKWPHTRASRGSG